MCSGEVCDVKALFHCKAVVHFYPFIEKEPQTEPKWNSLQVMRAACDGGGNASKESIQQHASWCVLQGRTNDSKWTTHLQSVSQGSKLLRINSYSMLQAGVAAVLVWSGVWELHGLVDARGRGLVTWEGARDSQRALRALPHLGRALSTFVGSTNPVTWLNTWALRSTPVFIWTSLNALQSAHTVSFRKGDCKVEAETFIMPLKLNTSCLSYNTMKDAF